MQKGRHGTARSGANKRMAASSQAGRRCALPVKKRQAARKVKMKDDMLRPVSLDSHEAQEIQFACKRTCWDVKNFEYQITDIQLVENDVLQSEFLQKQHELSVEGRSPKELIEEFAFLDVTDKTKRSAVCNSGLTTALSDTANSALGEPSQGVTVWRCPDLCIQKETEGGPKNHVVAMFKIMRGRPRTVVPQSNLGLPPKPAQNFDSHVPCVVFSGADDMTSAMQIYLYELNKVDHKPLTRPRHCCPYAIIFYKNKASQEVTSTKPAKVAKISKPVTSVTKQQPASGRRLIPFGEKMVTYYIAWSGTLTNKDKELGRVDFLAGQGCKVPSLGTKVVRVSSKMSLSSLRDVLPPECLKNVGSAWDKRLRHDSWRYNVLVVRPVQESRDTMARFCAFLRQSNSATVSTLLVSGAPAPVKLFLIPSCKFTEDLGLGACSDHGKMFAILSYKVLPPSSSTHSKQKNKKNSKEKTGMPLTEKQPFTTDYVDNDFVHDDYDVGDQLPSLANSFNTNVFTSVFNLEKPALKQMDQNTLKKTEPKSEDKQGKDSTIAEGSQAGSRVKDPSMQQPFRDISSGVVPNTEGRGRQRNGVLEQSNFADDASVGSRRSTEAPSQVLSAVDNAIPVDPRLARRRQPSSESNTSSIENRTPPMETPQSPDSISMTIPERDFVETESTTSHISSGKQLDTTSQSVQDKAVEQPEVPLLKKPSNAVTPKNDEDSAVTQTLGVSVKSSNEVKKTSVTPPTQAFLPKKRPVRGVFAHLKNKGPSHSATASLHLDTDLETVDLATTQRPRRVGIPFGSALKITVKNQNVLKENNKDCSTETKVIKKMKTDDTRSDAVVDTQMAEWSPTKQPTRDNYDNVMMDLDSDTPEHEGKDQEQKEKDQCEETQQQNSENGATEMEKSETNTHKHSKEEKGENDNTKKAAFDGPGRKKTNTEEAGTLLVPTHHRYNQGDSFYRANLIRNPWLDDNDELMQYRHVVPKGATNISPPRKGVAKEQKDNNSQVEQIQDQGQHQQKMGNNGVESEVNHSHRQKAATSERHSKEACSGGKLLMPDYLKAAQKMEAEDVTRNDVQETTKNQLDSQQTAAQEKDVKSREQRTHRNSSSSSTFSRSRSKSKSRTVNQTRSRSRSPSRGRNRTKSRNRRNPITRKRSTSRKSPWRRRSRSRSRQRDRSRSKSKDSPQGARSDGKAIPRARRSGISVPAVGRNVFPGSRMNITSPYRRKRPERRKRSSSSSSSDSSERPRKAYSQLDRCRRSRIRRNRTKRSCRSSDQRSSRDEDSSSCSPERRSKRRRGSRSNRSSESNDQQEGGKGNASHDRQEKKHDTEGQGKSRKAASPEKKCAEKDSRDPNQCSEEKKLMSKEKIDLVERVLFLTTGKMVKFDYADRVHRHLFRLDIESLQQEAKRLAINKGLSEDWLKEEFVCQPGSDEEEDEKPTDKHISTMTRGAIVYEILQLRKELNLTSGYNPNYMFKNMRRKDLIASLEKLRAAKQEILASSAWNMTKASLKVKKEAPKIFTTDTGCGENPVEILLQRKGDAIVKVAKDFVTHNKSMGLPVDTDKEEMTPKQLMRARCDDELMEYALNVFPNDPRYHSDVHMVDMQNNNAASESRSEATKKKLSIAETMSRSLEESRPGTLQDNAVKVEVVVAMERSPQTQHDQPVPQPKEAVKLVEPSADNCDVPMDTEEGDTENNMHGSRVLKSLSSLVEYATDSSEETMCQDVDLPDELEMTPEITSESEEDSCQEVPLKVEGNCKQLLKQDVESEAEAKWKQSFEQIERSKSENVFQQEIGEERECKIEKLKQVETESKSEDVFNQEVGTECERKEKLNQEVETDVKSEEIFEQRIEPDIQPRIKDGLEEGIIAETEGENIIHPEIKDETGSKSEENLKQVVKEECYSEESLKKPVPTESKSEENLRQPVQTESKSEENLKQPVPTESKSEENLKQPVQTESKSEENLKQRSQAKVELNLEEVESESRAKPVVLDREAKDALLEQNKDWVDKILEQATRPPEKVLGSKEDKDALLEKNKEWVDRVLERARRSPEIDSHIYRRYKERMAEQSRDCVRRDMNRADISASMTRRGSSEQISTGKEGGQQSSRWRGNSNKKKEDPMPVKQAWSAPRPISPTPGNLALQCSNIPAGGVSQAAYATGVGEETLRKAPVLVSHREKCLDCSAQPEQTPVKMADQHQSNKPHNANIMAMSGGQDCVPMDPRLRSNAKEFHDVTGSNNRDPSQGQSDAVGSVGAVRRNLLENELSDRAVGPGKDRGADFSPCDTTSGSGENSPEVLQMAAPQVDCGFLPPTKEEGIGPISPTGSDRELYKEKESNPHWFVNTERQPEKSRVGNDSSLVSPAGWYGSAVDNNSNCMQGKVPMREQVGLHSHSYPVQKPEWRQKFPWQEQGRSDNYSSPQVKSAVKPGWDSKIKAPVFPRPQKHHSSVGPRQVQNRRPPHVHPVPRMPYPRFQQHSQTRPPHPSPPHRPPPHYSQQQTSPQGLHQHPPMSPCRPPSLSPRHGCSQTLPRPLLNNVSPRPHHGPPTHMVGFMSAGQYSYKDTATEVNNKRTTDSQTPPRPLMNVSSRPHRGPPPHTGGFMSVGQYNQKNTATEVNNNRSDFQQDYGEQCRTPPTYPTQGRGMARGCPRGGGRGQPFPHPARGRAGLSGYPVRGGSVQRGRGGFRGRGFMAGAVQGRGRAQSAW